MKVEIGTEAAQFPEKEYINGIFVADCTVRKMDPIFTLYTAEAANATLYGPQVYAPAVPQTERKVLQNM